MIKRARSQPLLVMLTDDEKAQLAKLAKKHRVSRRMLVTSWLERAVRESKQGIFEIGSSMSDDNYLALRVAALEARIAHLERRGRRRQ